MKFKLTHSNSDGSIAGVTYPTLQIAQEWGFDACEFLHEMKVGEIRIDPIGDTWERIE